MVSGVVMFVDVVLSSVVVVSVEENRWWIDMVGFLIGGEFVE